MNQESQSQINQRLTTAAQLIDDAVTPICEAASIAVLNRHFTYSRALCDRAEQTFQARAGCLVNIAGDQPKATKQ